jgi:hypothetical protein
LSAGQWGAAFDVAILMRRSLLAGKDVDLFWSGYNSLVLIRTRCCNSRSQILWIAAANDGFDAAAPAPFRPAR